MTVQEALTEIVMKDKSLLKDGRKLAAELTERVPSGILLTSFSNALSRTNIGETLLAADNKNKKAHAKAKAEAIEQLRKINLQERYVEQVVETLIKALGWPSETQEPETDQKDRPKIKNNKDYYRIGLAVMRKGDYDKAVENFSLAIEDNHDYFEAYLNRGTSYAMKTEYELAIADFTQAIAINPGYANAYSQRGMLWAANDDYERAIADFNKALTIDKNNKEAKKGLKKAKEVSKRCFDEGIDAMRKGEYIKAESNFSRVIKIIPDHVEAYLNRGIAYDNMGEFDRAIADYTHAISLNQKDKDIYINRGVCYFHKKEYELAIADYKQALLIDEKDERASNNLQAAQKAMLKEEPISTKSAKEYYRDGLAAVDRQDYEQAMKDFSRAIEMIPTYVDALSMRGMLHKKEGAYDKAIADYSKIIEQNPYNTSAYHNRCICYCEKNDFQAALTDIDKVIDLNPDDSATDIRKKILARICIVPSDDGPKKNEDDGGKKKEDDDGKVSFIPKVVIVSIVILLIFSLAWNYENNTARKNEVSTSTSKIETKKAVSTSSTTTEKNRKKEASETFLGGVDIGMTEKELVSVMGNNYKTKNNYPGYTTYHYSSMDVYLKNNKVCGYMTIDNKLRTKRNIGHDSTESDLKKAYPDAEPYSVNAYKYRIQKEKNYMQMIFHLYKGKVSFMEFLDDPLVRVKDAAATLSNFYDHITNRRYNVAYNSYMSDYMKKRMGDYNSWVDGFKNTVSSKIIKFTNAEETGDSLVISYELEAVDNPGGRRVYKGKAYMVTAPSGNGWVIDSMENR